MVNRVGNSNLSRPGLSQADANRAARAEHKAVRARIDKSRNDINALRNSLLNPDQNAYNVNSGNNNSTLDQFLENIDSKYGHLESILTAPQDVTDKLSSLRESINTAKDAEKDRVTKVEGKLEDQDFKLHSGNPYFEQAARYNAKYRGMHSLHNYYPPEWMDLDGSVKPGYEIPGSIKIQDVEGQMETDEIGKKINEAQTLKTEISLRSSTNGIAQQLLLDDMLNIFKSMNELLETKIENQESIIEQKKRAMKGKSESSTEAQEYNQATSELSTLQAMKTSVDNEIQTLN